MHDARDAEDSRLLEANEHARLLATYYPVVVERCRVRLRDPDAYEVAHRVVERLLRELTAGEALPRPIPRRRAAEPAAEAPPLGYRGCWLRAPDGREWRAGGGGVECGGDARADPDGAVERAILATEPPGVLP